MTPLPLRSTVAEATALSQHSLARNCQILGLHETSLFYSTRLRRNPSYDTYFCMLQSKGSVGKSISTASIELSIAGALHNTGAPNSRVLLIDTDSQVHATLVTPSRNNYGTDNSLYEVLMTAHQTDSQVLANCVAQSKWDDNLHVLKQTKRELQGKCALSPSYLQCLFLSRFTSGEGKAIGFEHIAKDLSYNGC